MDITKTEIDVTKPGRELDEAIAKAVFDKFVISSEGMALIMAAGGPNLKTAQDRTIPAYSSDIAAAWLVFDKMKGQTFSKRRRFLHSLTQTIRADLDAVVSWPDLLIFMEPRHVCVAALRNLGIIA